MSDSTTRVDRHAWKKNQEALFGNPEFVSRWIAPLVPELGRERDPSDWTLEIVRNKASARLTLSYTFGAATKIYGKAYFDPTAASEAYDSLASFWKHGFAPGSTLEVPEPLGIVTVANLVLIRSASGTPMDKRAGSNAIEAACADARSAARWLVKFHGTKIAGLRAESPCEKLEIFKIADAMAKVASECPEHSARLIDMIHGLRTLSPRGNSSPAVARFCHVLKKTCLEERGDLERCGRVADEFVAEYRIHSESNLENLAYFRALLALKAFAKLLKNKKIDETHSETMRLAYQSEFERWVQRGLPASMAA
jgi:hypothetical protein